MPHPPSLPLRFFRWYCHPRVQDYVEGDLMEVYERRVKTSGKRTADFRFVLDVLLLFRPGIIHRDILPDHLINTIMLRNYITTAYRNILKNKTFSAINILGLGIGMAACLLILQFVSFDLSFDTFHSKLDRTYRITNDRFQNGKLIQHGTITYPTIGPTIAKDYPEVEEYTRLMPGGDLNIRIDERNFRGDECLFADERFFSVFDFKLLAGDRATMLKDPYTVVISEEMALKLFEVKDRDYESVLDKTFLLGLDPTPYTIKGVCANIPENSHIQFDALIAYSTLYRGDENDADTSWTWSDMRHYLVLKPGTDYKALEAKFPEFSDRYFQGDKVSGSVEKFYLQPLRDAHLYSDYEYDIAHTSNGKAVWAMLIVAGFILLIAWINYVNLTISRALDRAKEVGLRKVMGAYKGQLVKQFVLESLAITILAMGVALLIVLATQGVFNSIIGNTLSLAVILTSFNSKVVLITIGLLVSGALLAGFYPAFILSSYHPALVLKGKFSRSVSGNFLRKSLVVFQFTASAALIAGTMIVSKQLSFMNNADLGMSIENTVIVLGPELMEFDSTFIDRVESYKNELNQINGVTHTTTSNRIAGRRLARAFGIRMADQPTDAHFTLSHMGIDYNYFDTYDIKVVAGRGFLRSDHKAHFRDVTAIVVNESAVKLLGIESPEKAVGQELIWGNNGTRKWTIVGVVNDVHQESLRKLKEAMVFRPNYSTYSPISIKVKSDDVQQLMGNVETLYQKFFPGNSFEYFFLDENYQRQYMDDKRFGTVINIFTGLAILVSCLGLMGLASYTASQRTKEIGVRKVLGASVGNILYTLAKDLLKPILIAGTIAAPLAWVAMNSWLQEFVYRIEIKWLTFLLAGLAVGLIALATISLQAAKAANANPVKSLRNE